MGIKEYFEKYDGMIIGFRKQGKRSIIDVFLNKNWKVDERNFTKGILVSYNDSKQDDNSIYYIFYSEVVDFDVIFDEISKTIKWNQEEEQKKELFNKKVAELNRFFKDNDLKNLEKLKIELNDFPEYVLDDEKDVKVNNEELSK